MSRPSASTARPGLRLLGLLVVVAGLFGMHGLASHGVQGMDMVPGTVVTSGPMSASLAPFASKAVSVEGETGPTRDHSDSLPGGDSEQGGMDMSIAMMCVVILGAALLALLQMLRRERPWSVLGIRPYRTRSIMHPSRGADPPSLLDLSIQRC